MSVVGQPLYADEWPGGPRGCRRRRRRHRGGGDACDACDACDVCDACDGCDLFLLGLLRLLLVEPFRHAGGAIGTAAPVPPVCHDDPPLPRPVRVLLAALRWYKREVSARRGPVCRLTPSCSAYAAEAVRRHGVLRGGRLSWRRLRRCRPAGPRGADPVP